MGDVWGIITMNQCGLKMYIGFFGGFMRDTVNISRVSFIECPTVGCTQQLQPYFVKKSPKTDVHCIVSPEFQSMQGPQPDDQFLG